MAKGPIRTVSLFLVLVEVDNLDDIRMVNIDSLHEEGVVGDQLLFVLVLNLVLVDEFLGYVVFECFGIDLYPVFSQQVSFDLTTITHSD